MQSYRFLCINIYDKTLISYIAQLLRKCTSLYLDFSSSFSIWLSLKWFIAFSISSQLFWLKYQLSRLAKRYLQNRYIPFISAQFASNFYLFYANVNLFHIKGINFSWYISKDTLALFLQLFLLQVKIYQIYIDPSWMKNKSWLEDYISHFRWYD